MGKGAILYRVPNVHDLSVRLWFRRHINRFQCHHDTCHMYRRLGRRRE
jgi:hypothetical protein